MPSLRAEKTSRRNRDSYGDASEPGAIISGDGPSSSVFATDDINQSVFAAHQAPASPTPNVTRRTKRVRSTPSSSKSQPISSSNKADSKQGRKKKPANAFFLFRSHILAHHILPEGTHQNDVSTTAGRLWKEASQETKVQFYRMAAVEKLKSKSEEEIPGTPGVGLILEPQTPAWTTATPSPFLSPLTSAASSPGPSTPGSSSVVDRNETDTYTLAAHSVTDATSYNAPIDWAPKVPNRRLPTVSLPASPGLEYNYTPDSIPSAAGSGFSYSHLYSAPLFCPQDHSWNGNGTDSTSTTTLPFPPPSTSTTVTPADISSYPFLTATTLPYSPFLPPSTYNSNFYVPLDDAAQPPSVMPTGIQGAIPRSLYTASNALGLGLDLDLDFDVLSTLSNPGFSLF